MGLLDWITEGIGSSMGQDATGSGAMLPQTMPPDMGPPPPPPQPTGVDAAQLPPPAQAPLTFQRPEFAQPPALPPGGDPMTAGGATPNGPGLPPMPPPPQVAGRPGMPPSLPPLTVPEANGIYGSYKAAGGGGPVNIQGSAANPDGNAPPPGAPAKVPGGASFIGRALGLDANQEKSMFGSLGAGLTAAGNSKGKSKGQALFSGAGGAIEGGQKAEDKAYDQRLKSLQLAVTAQAAGDKAAYNKNYAEYLKGKLSNEAGKATPGGRSAWNKPDSQKFIDAQNALAKDPEIRASQKMLENGTGNLAAHNALIARKQEMYLTGVGLSPQAVQAMAGNPPGTPKNPHIVNSQQDFDTYVKPGQAYKNPADGQIYIRKAGEGKGAETDTSTTPDVPPQPPGPRPDTIANNPTAPAEED